MELSTTFNAGVPSFGTWVLYAFMITSACAFALAVAAATAERDSSNRLLHAARLAALGTCALVTLDVLLLLYAFLSHDFRIRYVSHYSDRSMPIAYLITALWGGQDGSLLWWSFLLAGYTTACILWLRGRYRELAPWVIATLMLIVLFFGVLMAFAANPFSANVAGAPADGEGLNPSLQNFYMAIHPPSLYTGFVGCAVPFAFAAAALLSGRLDEEWIGAVRKWALFAWLFLSIGNTLGMLWAYEELGWGGFWAWDPVENAACIPWWTCTAFLHSVMIQERRGSLKVWNVVLIMLTFILTIFGTFLTRSGLIASIHSFAQSEVGIYFVYFMAFLLAASVALIAYRYRQLKSDMEIDSVLSREAMFIANNWLLLGICVFIVVATTWPKISEWLWNERLTVGASFYNFWLPVPACVLLALMAIGTLTPWRKGSPALLRRAFMVPLAVGALVAVAHILLGGWLERPAYVPIEPIYPSTVGRVMAKIDGALPPVIWGLMAFNIAAIAQEYFRGVQSRRRGKNEGALRALGRLVSKNKRRYGGYIVHVGFVMMIFGWSGTYWHKETEASVHVGETFNLGHYAIRYDGVERQRDPNKTMIIANLTALRDGQPYVIAHPAKYIYTTHPEMPTSEVSITPGLREDLYLVLASVNPTTHIAHFKAFVNPFVLWIWLGWVVLMLGCAIAMWPELNLTWAFGTTEEGDRSGGGGGGTLAPAGMARKAALVLPFLLAGAVLTYGGLAHAQGHTNSQPPPVGGTTEDMTPTERHMFDRMLCMCGDCQRLPLSTCTCDFAATTRAVMRDRLHQGVSPDEIVRRYVERFGPAALAVPPDAGHNRAVWVVPFAVIGLGAVGAFFIVKRWRDRRQIADRDTASTRERAAERSGQHDYDLRLDEELRGLDD